MEIIDCWVIYIYMIFRTPLMLSVLGGHTDCVYSLINKGANVDAKDKWGRTALHRGVNHDWFSSVFLLALTCVSALECGSWVVCVCVCVCVCVPFRRWQAMRSAWRPCCSTMPVSWYGTVGGAHQCTLRLPVATLGFWGAFCMLPSQ